MLGDARSSGTEAAKALGTPILEMASARTRFAAGLRGMEGRWWGDGSRWAQRVAVGRVTMTSEGISSAAWRNIWASV